MGPTFLLDENLRGKKFWQAILSHNQPGQFPIDAVRVGDPPDLPAGTLDPEILLWAERTGRILLTLDVNTMPGHFQAHLAAGRHSPGVMVIRASATLVDVVDYLAFVSEAGFASDYEDTIRFIPEP